ncbi:MAG: LssY C-terminal domain-containing protein [Gammaproteobacteria bacterium]|nr:LssY C-terminal domain-containing protein [Gammaproteobacteria bacterium]
MRIAALLCLLTLCSCASAPEYFNTIPEGDYRERIQVQEKQGVSVSAGVPSAKETRELFGRNLYRRGIQPVWLRVENQTENPVTLLPFGLDPQYFTPLEVANYDLNEKKPPESLIDRYILDQRVRLVNSPGEELSGYVFNRQDEGTKAFNVDVASEGNFRTFTFFIAVPGLNIDHYSVDWANLYPEDQWREFEASQLIDAIEEYACCVTDKEGENNGDPLNLILIGKPVDIYTAFIRAGWDETEAINKSSSWKTMKSFFSGGEYRYSPVSSLYVFGRPQDVAFQKARENIHERNHLRLWMAPVTFEGVPVWIGQISRDIGVRFTTKTITTHKIDPDVDETREYLLENLAYSQSLKTFGYVGGVGEVSMDAPKGNLTGDPWFSDGYRLVLWVTSEPVALDEIDVLNWRIPTAIRD